MTDLPCCGGNQLIVQKLAFWDVSRFWMRRLETSRPQAPYMNSTRKIVAGGGSSIKFSGITALKEIIRRDPMVEIELSIRQAIRVHPPWTMPGRKVEVTKIPGMPQRPSLPLTHTRARHCLTPGVQLEATLLAYQGLRNAEHILPCSKSIIDSQRALLARASTSLRPHIV
jgi:hypothetical protein